MKTKRILSLFLAGAVICASLPAAAAAGETTETKSEPAAVAETTAETAAQLTAETAEQVTAETAAQTDAETAAQTDAETAAQADAQAAAESSTDSSLVTRTVPFYLCDLNRSIDLPLYFVNGVRDVPFVSLSDWTKVMTTIYNVLGADQDYQLTLETDDIASWQPGDIVCYHEHIGIVSDRRNAAGVPFVIHHWGSLQHSFEEDRLAAFGRIEGHWRIS